MITTIMNSHPKLNFEFYKQPTIEVAKNLLGKKLLRVIKKNDSNVFLSGIITETEAYLFDDPASHSYSGKSQRNAAMFEKEGTVYIYKIYGIHYCLNVVTAQESVGEAVLIRAIFPIKGVEYMRQNRKKVKLQELCNGPGNLTQALSLDLNDNRKELLGNEIYITDSEYTLNPEQIIVSKRIGIKKNSNALLRFQINSAHFNKSGKVL